MASISSVCRLARPIVCACALVAVGAGSVARADVVTSTNERTAEIASKLTPTPFAVRAVAIAQVAVFAAANAVTQKYIDPYAIPADTGASLDAAVAAANRGVLLELVPNEREAIEAGYAAAMRAVPVGPARQRGITLGERAASAVLAARADDGAAAPNAYRPTTAAGVYAPTTLPAVPHWGQRRPWFMSSGRQFRPPPPPALDTETWARDYNEIRIIGARQSEKRTAEQTASARFWEATAPVVYWHVVRSIAAQSGRDVTANARLLAVAAMAMDDALIAVFDAKYFYNFWRPITAIRNGDLDGNDATTRDPEWMPLIDTPMHPEYPCAHCILASSLATVLETEVGDAPMPQLNSISPLAPDLKRSWRTIAEFARDVSEARICDGVHFRNSTEVATAMGRKIGSLAVERAAQRKQATR
ncbi:MAG TPA: vanadium-dependent haloperoxidase [Steroidobacteraceae bacterium]|nr:vanadium-dependent haloperoxidase [Steroidobacteraceae bacterium]